MSFFSLGLSEALVRAVGAAGYNQPTPVQQRAIPVMLQGRDPMVAAQTGIGKTSGFALSVLERLFPVGHPDREHRHGPRQAHVLVLASTHELVAQVHDGFKVYARDLSLNSTCTSGGVGMNLQVQTLIKGVDVFIACPSRLFDLAGQNKVDPSHVEILVLDGADYMLDMDFIRDVKRVLTKLSLKRQNLLLSATFSKDIVDLANELLYNPEHVEVAPPSAMVERIEQRVFRLPVPQKCALPAYLVTVGAWEQVLVFTRTKHGASRLTEYPTKHGLPATAIHSNKSQNAWIKALADFKVNNVRILMATDTTARGLDIDQLPHVINHELPNVEENYVHRIGHTGRAGRSGEATSLVVPNEGKLLKAIEKTTRQCILDGDTQGFDSETVLPEVAQPEPHEAPQEQPRRDKERRSSREHKPKDAQANNPDSSVVTAQDDAKKPAGKRHHYGGRNKKSRGIGQAQQPQQNREARLAKPNWLPEVNGNRDPEEFLDDDLDDSGNRADCASPYQDQENKGRGRRNDQQRLQGDTSQQGRGQGRDQAYGKSQDAAQGGAHGQGTDQGKAKKPRASKPCDQGRENIPWTSGAPLREPSECGTGKQPSRQPVVINEHDLVRMDHFPTTEQLGELEPWCKGEHPTLLTRNH